MPSTSKDYYKILQVDSSADPEIIVVAYKRLARKYYPDMNKAPDATLRMQEINMAYQVLHDPIKRTQYDRTQAARSSESGARDAEDRRKREEPETAKRHTEEERYKRAEAEASWRHTERPVMYEFSRLCFKADVIESLSDQGSFRVVTPVGIFQMTKADFYRDFANVVRSRSYREGGIYHYPTVPQKALGYQVG
jgi:curved DNA-binding protein CbpA